MANILITYGWCRTAYVAAKSCHKRGHTVYSCSHISPSMTSASKYCKASSIVHDFSEFPAQYVSDIASLIEEWRIDVVLPVHEDALIIRKLQDRLSKNVIVASPSFDRLVLGLNKISITKLAESIGVPIPKSVYARSGVSPHELEIAANEIGYPVVVKVSDSNSAKGVWIANTKQDITLIAKQMQTQSRAPQSKVYVQEYIKGPVVGACFFSREGKIDSIFCEIYLRVKDGSIGTSTFREVFVSEKLTDYTGFLAKEMCWSGMGHFDFIYDRLNDEFYLLEMNPRPWGGINHAYVNGFDFIGAEVSRVLGSHDEVSGCFKRTSTYSRSMWILGEGIRALSLVREKKFLDAVLVPFQILSNAFTAKFDDFSLVDPAPFFTQCLCYLRRFRQNDNDFNP